VKLLYDELAQQCSNLIIFAMFIQLTHCKRQLSLLSRLTIIQKAYLIFKENPIRPKYCEQVHPVHCVWGWSHAWKASIHVPHESRKRCNWLFRNYICDIITVASGKISTMPKHQSTQVFVFFYSKIWKCTCLITFFSHYTNTYMSWLNHVYIVWAISYS